MVNDNFEKCNDLAECEGKFFWIDGTPADPSTTSHFVYVSTQEHKTFYLNECKSLFEITRLLYN